MDMFLFKKIIDDAVENGFITLTFSLYNEPLLDNLIFERVRYAKEKGLKVFLIQTVPCSLVKKCIKL